MRNMQSPKIQKEYFAIDDVDIEIHEKFPYGSSENLDICDTIRKIQDVWHVDGIKLIHAYGEQNANIKELLTSLSFLVKFGIDSKLFKLSGKIFLIEASKMNSPVNIVQVIIENQLIKIFTSTPTYDVEINF